MENSSTIKLSNAKPWKLGDVIWCSVFVAESLAIVVGNFFAILVFTTGLRLRKRRTYLLLSLALADLLVGLIALPLWIYQSGSRTRLWDSTLPIPGFIAYCALDLFTNLASISNLAAISLERFYATFWPWHHRAAPRTQYMFFIAVVWTLSALISVIYTVARFVLFSTLATMYTWLPYFCLLLLSICSSYTAIFIKVGRGNHRSRLDRERKLTTTLFIATVFSIAAFLPLVVVGVFYFAMAIEINDAVMTVLSFINFGNCLVNPVLYSFRMPDFRKAVYLLFCNKRQQPHRHVTGPSRDKASAVRSTPVPIRIRVLPPAMQSKSCSVEPR